MIGYRNITLISANALILSDVLGDSTRQTSAKQTSQEGLPKKVYNLSGPTANLLGASSGGLVEPPQNVVE
ncbi:MAG: hypothetical protein ABUK01_18400 [Leptospirales bacterium]